MAVLAVAGIGALGSSALGFGWQAGWLIGSAVGNTFFGPKLPDQEGPRLQDLNVTSSAYGAPIPKAYSSMRMNGNVIWAEDLIEVKKTETVGGGGGGKGGGGGGGSVQSTTYSYYANFAIAFSEGEADTVVRIWANTTLIYDTSSTTSFSKIRGLDFRFYKGTEDQQPDPLIASVEGEDSTPAHRGVVYMVFERFPLAKFGNSIPNITAEIAYIVNDVKPYLSTQNYPDGVNPALALAPDYTRNRFFVYGDDGGFYRLNSNTLQVERRGSPLSAPDGYYLYRFTSFAVGPDGYLIAALIYRDNINNYYYEFVRKLDPTTLQDVMPPKLTRQIIIFDDEYVGWDFVPVTSSSGTYYLAIAYEDSIYKSQYIVLDYENLDVLEETTLGGGNYVKGVLALPPITTGAGGGQFYGFYAATTPEGKKAIAVQKVTYKFRPGLDPDTPWERTSELFDYILAEDINDDTEVTYNFIASAYPIALDPYDNGVISATTIAVTGGPDGIWTFKWTPEDGVVWRVTGNIGRSYTDWQEQKLPVTGTHSANTINTADGTYNVAQDWEDETEELVGTSPYSSFTGTDIYNSLENSIITRIGTSFYLATVPIKTVKIFLNRQEAVDTSLSGIVASLCADSGLTPSDYDVSELNDISVPGYVVSRRMSLRSALEPLANAFFFDVVESDGILKFKIRGSDPVETINADYLLLKNETGSRIEERRAMEVELPSEVSVIYSDRQTDYQQGSQSAKRIATTNSSRNTVSLELPMSLNGTAARQIAQKFLASAWNGRTTVDFSTTLDFLKLDPTDVVNVLLDDGTNFTIRITDLEVGADYSVTLKGVSEYAASYVSDVQGGESQGFTPQIPIGDIATEVILPDMPLLQDADDLGGRGSRLYSFTSGFDAVDWVGATTFRSDDGGSSWDRIVANNETLPWGIANNALPAPISPFKTDEDNSLIVSMETLEDQLESVTQLQMLNGANAALLLTSDGKPEIIQFRDVAVNVDGTVTLSGLLRGRRGTDVFCGDHKTGDLFVFLNNIDGEAFSIPLSDLNDPLDIKVVPNGESFDAVTTITKTYTGRDLKPYAPVNFSASLEGDGSLTLGWFRRTRIGGELENTTGDVFLAESFERYDVEILDGPDGDVLRTYVDITSPTATYSAADYATDFPSGSNALTFRVYQKSEVVGRGFPGEETVEVL